jgi:YVTN family beta-propeller protein
LRAGRIRLALAGGLLLACQTGPTSVAGIASVTVNPSTVTMLRHSQDSLRAVIVTDNGDTLTGQTIAWTSDNPSVATIGTDNVVRSFAAFGDVQVHGQVGELASATVTVHVIGVPKSLALAPSDTTISPAGHVTYRITVVDTSGAVIPNALLSFGIFTQPGVVVQSGHTLTAEGHIGEVSVVVSSGPSGASAALHIADTISTGILTAVGDPVNVTVSSRRVALIPRVNSVFLSRINLPTHGFAHSPRVPSGLSAVVFDSAGDRAYAVGPSRAFVTVIDVPLDSMVDSLAIGGASLGTLGLGGDDRTLWIPSADGLRGVDRLTGIVSGPIALPGNPGQLTHNAARDSLWYVAVGGVSVVEVDVRADSVTRQIIGIGGVAFLAGSPDGTQLYVTDRFGQRLRVVDVGSGTVIDSVAFGSAPDRVRLSPEGDQIWVSLPSAGTIGVFDRTTRAPIQTLTIGGAPLGVGFDPATRIFLVANDSGWVNVLAR